MPRPFEQEDVPVRNHAMECRINAQIPDFLPSCGTVTALRVCRVVRACAGIPPCLPVRTFLSVLRLCSASSSCVRPRDGAIRKMRSALGELVIEA